ncbi:hypothetical protein [Cyclobacterium plantarum]|uniref:Uncharacterized protein n=1 Tax=Cyclobacterium plantarum TaxID=2716263 RepID=A0ABX0H453_9BACT|nr:hypothetical protein [Cyclobacterium plantarum]NHE56601.1 hypothetical protein [Cyclobacterium plantarum]
MSLLIFGSIAPGFTGSFYFEPEKLMEGYGFVSPNFTPYKKMGIISFWPEEFILNRYKSGRIQETSPMP